MNTPIYIIVPETLNSNGGNLMGYDPSTLNYKDSHWKYLHGLLQDKSGYDIFGYKGEAPTEEGIYNALVEFPDVSIPSTIFIWKKEFGIDRNRGLVVTNEDIEVFNEVKQMYNNKTLFI